MKIRTGLFVALLCHLLLAGCASVQTSSPDERYDLVRKNLGKLAVGGTVSNVKWSEDNSALFFTRGKEKFRFELGIRHLESIDKKYEGKASANVKPRGPRHPGRGKQRAAAPSPDGKWNAVSKDWNVALERRKGDKKIPVTTDGDNKLRYGTASWVYGEELYQNDAMWWSPDSSLLAFYKFDESEVKDFYLIGDLTKFRTRLMTEGFPKAGEPNPVATLLVYDMKSKKTAVVDCGDDTEQYVYNVRFTPGGDELLFYRTNRRQNVFDLMAADPRTGKSRAVLTEKQETWHENLPELRFLEDGKRFIWETEKTGYAQYELRHLDGRLLGALTKGEYPVMGIEYVDESTGWFFYTAHSDAYPLSLQIHKARLDGKGQKRLTSFPLGHSGFQISPDGKWVVAKCEAYDTPPRTVLYDSDGNRAATLAESDASKIEELGLYLPERFTYKASDGKTDLYGQLYKPSNFDPKRKYPLIVDVYGGPVIPPRLRNRFSPVKAATEYGFLVAVMDNRGTPGRGRAFESATYLKLGIVDIQDQVDGVKFLSQRPYVDSRRVGIVGSSYGGYMSALGVMKYPDVFHAGVAKSAVTDWRQYDTIYTERIMRTPEENPEGYRDSSCLTFVDRFKGHLLIMHGLIDDNVHPTNVWQLVDALDKAGKPYESRFFPRHGHGLSASSNKTQWDFFRKHLIEEFEE